MRRDYDVGGRGEEDTVEREENIWSEGVIEWRRTGTLLNICSDGFILGFIHICLNILRRVSYVSFRCLAYNLCEVLKRSRF
jgi:hypothetical protein